MHLNIKALGIELTDAIRAAVEKKMESIENKTQRFGDGVRAEVEVSKTTHHHKSGPFFRAEIHVILPGKAVRAEATHDDLYVAIGQAKEEVERQIIAYKEKKG